MEASTSAMVSSSTPYFCAVGRGDHGEHGGRGQRPGRPVAGRVHGVEPLVAAVLHLLGPHRHGHVVGARRHGVRRRPQRLGPGGAVVLDPGHRLVAELQRTGQRDAAHAALGRAEPVGVDVVLGDAGRGEGLRAGVDDEVVEPLVPVLGEGRATHADDGHLVPDPVRAHQFVSSRAHRARLPEVVVDAVGAEEPPEGHLDPAAGPDLLGVDVGQLDREAAAAVEVDDGEDDGRAG